MDITVVNPFQQLTIARAAREPGYALQMRRHQKWSKYGEACRAEGIMFKPLVVETCGAWEEGAMQVIRKLGQALARATCQDDSEVIGHLFGKLSVLLMRDNVRMILNRVPTQPHPSIDGEI